MVAGALSASPKSAKAAELGAQLVSSHWYRVAGIKPRLRDHLKAHAHRYRGQLWHVVEDRISAKFHRFDTQAWRVMRLLDGQHTLDAIWHHLAAQGHDDMPSQEDILNLLGQLHALDLLVVDTLPDLAEAARRGAKQDRQRWMAKYMNPLAIRMHLWDPDRFLAQCVQRWRPWLGQWTVLAWLALVLPALGMVVVHWQDLTHNATERLLAMDNLILVAVLFPLVKGLHELGHGLACKLRGGDVHDMGVMWLLFLPVPYVEASSSWAFPDKRDRMLVGAAGMLVEMALAAIALWLWLWLEPGLAKALAYDVAVLASVTTVLFNGNPLLRYDGYYVASDALEIPNLAQRASRYWGFLFERHIARKRDATSPAMAPGEVFWFTLYAPLSLAYRCFVMLSIALFVAAQYLTLGVLMAVWSVSMGVVWPLVKSLKRAWGLTQAPDTSRLGQRLIWGFALLLILLLVAVPLPHRTQVEGVLWLPEEGLVRAEQSGFIDAIHVAAGTQVRPGQGIANLRDGQLSKELQVQEARLAAAQVRMDSALVNNASLASQAQTVVTREQAVLRRLQERSGHLMLTSHAQGQLWLPAGEDLMGRYLKKGQVLAYVMPTKAPRVRVIIDQADEDLIRQQTESVQVRLPSDPGQIWEAHMVRAVPGASRQLPSAAMSRQRGGEVVTDPRDESGRLALQSYFEYELALPDGFPHHLIGSRVSVRFEHAMEPLAPRVWRAARRLFLSHFQS